MPPYSASGPANGSRADTQPVSGGAYSLEPWSAAWYDYCEARYRSFDPDTGTYTGYDGRTRFCVAG